MITVTYTAKGYSPDKVKARYVRLDVNDVFRFCEVGEARSYDLRQGTVDYRDLPFEVAEDARARAGTFPGYVDWNF